MITEDTLLDHELDKNVSETSLLTWCGALHQCLRPCNWNEETISLMGYVSGRSYLHICQLNFELCHRSGTASSLVLLVYSLTGEYDHKGVKRIASSRLTTTKETLEHIEGIGLVLTTLMRLQTFLCEELGDHGREFRGSSLE
jgi:hypothetical protein